MKSALYPGSFDPITNGHLDIIRRAAAIFDSLTVAVAVNVDKKALFSVEERLEMIEEAIKGISRVRVASFNGLLVEYAVKNGINMIVKGLRAISDFEFELQMASMNRKLDSRVETLFMMTASEYSFLSSSMVREVAGYGGSVAGLVPAHVEKRLIARLKEEADSRSCGD